MGTSDYKTTIGKSLRSSLPYPQRTRALSYPSVPIAIGANVITVIETIDIGVGLGQSPAPALIPQGAPWWWWRFEFELLVDNANAATTYLDVAAVYSAYTPAPGTPTLPTYAAGQGWGVPKHPDGTFSPGVGCYGLFPIPANASAYLVKGRVWSLDMLPTANAYPELTEIFINNGSVGVPISFLKGGSAGLPGTYLIGSASATGLSVVGFAGLATLEPVAPEWETGNCNGGILLGEM
jgi:hypothetical protein